MGIHKFFYHFKNTYTDSISIVGHDGTVPKPVDNLLIDFNAQIHTATQKAYEYGAHKPNRFLDHSRPRLGYLERQKIAFEDVAQSVEKLLEMVRPKKRLLIFIDGVAPQCKQNQQKKRRFVSAVERVKSRDNRFDSASISPGTKFMDYLSKFLDFYIKKRVTEQQGRWKGLEVIFSNEKVVGEGEWKLMQWLRKNHASPKGKDESNCVCGMDADLIMLALASGTKNLSILREEPQDQFFGYYFIDIDSTMNTLAFEMNWGDSGKTFDPETAMLDFMFICYTIGNDFLPKVETVDVTLGSIDTMLEIYKKVCRENGHLIKRKNEEKEAKNRLKKRSVSAFFTELGKSEQEVMTEKLKQRGNFFEDPLLNKYGVYENLKETSPKETSPKETKSGTSPNKFTKDPKVLDFDIRGYRRAYYAEKLEIKDRTSVQNMVFEYLKGMQFVLEYYTSDTVPSWTWKYPYHYAPFSYDIGKYCTKYVRTEFEAGIPYPPFLQLMSILPEASSSLLPAPLAGVMNARSTLKEYYPREFNVDYAGKSREYEGVVLLPILSGVELEKVYREQIEFVEEPERRRNTVGKTFIYTPGRSVLGKPLTVTPIKYLYGQINSTARVRMT